MANKEFNLDLIEQSFQTYKMGAVINATVVGVTAAGIVVNIGGKNDGLISGTEVEEYRNLSKGAKIDVMVTSSKATDGVVAVSAKKAQDTVAMNVQIPDIKKGATFEAIVDSSSNAGLNCFFGSYRVFVPASEVEEFFVRDLSRYKGKKLEMVATDFDEEKRQIVASRKVVVSKARLESEELFWHGIYVGKLVTGRVARITTFGAFVNIDGVDCLVHNSEVSYDRSATAESTFTVGNEYQFRVISVNRDERKVQLSHKQLAAHPFDEQAAKLTVGDIVEGEVVKILPFGAVLKLDSGLEGLVHISEVTSKTYVKNVHEVCKAGERKSAMVKEIDVEKKRLSLSIKATETQEQQ
jgi:ribosomal protein S1